MKRLEHVNGGATHQLHPSVLLAVVGIVVVKTKMEEEEDEEEDEEKEELMMVVLRSRDHSDNFPRNIFQHDL